VGVEGELVGAGDEVRTELSPSFLLAGLEVSASGGTASSSRGWASCFATDVSAGSKDMSILLASIDSIMY
jgi:hypothetical protein